jgi:hypothetical protein
VSGLADDVVDVVEHVADGLADAAASLFEGAAPFAGTPDDNADQVT